MEALYNKVNDLVTAVIEQANQAPISGVEAVQVQQEQIANPVHCLRSASQRSLSTPVTFLSNLTLLPAGSDLFSFGVTGATGALAGVTSAPINFHDSNDQTERQRIDELVLIAIRSKVAVMLQAGLGGPGTPFDVGSLPVEFAKLINQYVVLRAYSTADTNDPWIGDTPLSFFERPGGEFVPVPPVYWRDRGPKMQLDTRTADKGALAGSLPTFFLSDNAVDLQVSIQVESLWIPRPDVCGSHWPGEQCPATHVKNADGYKGH